MSDIDRTEERTKTAERPDAVPWYKTPGGAAGIFVGILLAGGCFLIVAALAIQLADSSPKVDPSKMGSSEYKTVEQAREELQSRIDRYLGGQRDPNTFNLDFALWSAEIKVSNIEIVRVGPRVNEVAGIVPNTFTAVLRCSAETEKFGANLATKEITIKYLSYERGQWTIPK